MGITNMFILVILMLDIPLGSQYKMVIIAIQSNTTHY
jgi:hypothetical protein